MTFSRSNPPPSSAGEGWRYIADYQPAVGSWIEYIVDDFDPSNQRSWIIKTALVMRRIARKEGFIVERYPDKCSFRLDVGFRRCYWRPAQTPWAAVSAPTPVPTPVPTPATTQTGDNVFSASSVQAKGGYRGIVTRQIDNVAVWESEIFTDQYGEAGVMIAAAHTLASNAAIDAIKAVSQSLFDNYNPSTKKGNK